MNVLTSMATSTFNHKTVNCTPQMAKKLLVLCLCSV